MPGEAKAASFAWRRAQPGPANEKPGRGQHLITQGPSPPLSRRPVLAVARTGKEVLNLFDVLLRILR